MKCTILIKTPKNSYITLFLGASMNSKFVSFILKIKKQKELSLDYSAI